MYKLRIRLCLTSFKGPSQNSNLPRYSRACTRGSTRLALIELKLSSFCRDDCCACDSPILVKYLIHTVRPEFSKYDTVGKTKAKPILRANVYLLLK